MVLTITTKVDIFNEQVCKRCGSCCWYVYPPTGQLKKCRYLVLLTNHRSLCRMYTQRTRRVVMIDKYSKDGILRPIQCLQRKDSKYNYRIPGGGDCPFNVPHKPYFDSYLKHLVGMRLMRKHEHEQKELTISVSIQHEQEHTAQAEVSVAQVCSVPQHAQEQEVVTNGKDK